MTISSYQIHSVLRTYGKQLRRGARLNRVKQVSSEQPADKINISPEAKRQQVIERVATEILARLAEPGPHDEGIEKDILASLSQEYGQPLRLGFDQAGGRFTFSIFNADQGEIIKMLDEKESAILQEKLVEITRRQVDRTML